jgi:glycosyltransferase involved in cell wall biosynthesis
MNIVIVDRGAKIPATKYGGTERVIWGLGYELNKMGHQITFIVPSGSSCDFGKVIHYNPNVELEKLIPKDTDIVHLNFPIQNELTFPYLLTMHGNTKKGDILPLNTVFISKNHAERNNSEVYVHNGLLWDDYPNININQEKKYLHFLAKASWSIKNLPGAAEIAIKSNNKLKVLGGEKWKFYNFKRKPFFTLHPNIKYCGLVDNNQKMEIMQYSKGLVFPVNWDEPFGLAIIESLYAGCPVFGTKKGSLPELINENIGFISDDIDEIIEAIKTKKFDPKTCNTYAVDNFNSKIMTENYLKLYKRILNGEYLNKTAPYAS